MQTLNFNIIFIGCPESWQGNQSHLFFKIILWFFAYSIGQSFFNFFILECQLGNLDLSLKDDQRRKTL